MFVVVAVVGVGRGVRAGRAGAAAGQPGHLDRPAALGGDAGRADRAGRRRDELKELADTFDAMLARLDAAFDSQRRFVANASHELRTPLSVIRTEVDVTLADPARRRAELRTMGEVVREASMRADRLVDALLVLARSDGQARQGLAQREPVDLAALVPAAVARSRPRRQRAGWRCRTETRPAPVEGDPQLLERLVGNLVENAVRHNVDGGWVTVRTGTDTVRRLAVRPQHRPRGRPAGEVDGAVPAVPPRRAGADRLPRRRPRPVDRPCRGRGARRRGDRLGPVRGRPGGRRQPARGGRGPGPGPHLTGTRTPAAGTMAAVPSPSESASGARTPPGPSGPPAGVRGVRRPRRAARSAGPRSRRVGDGRPCGAGRPGGVPGRRAGRSR